MQASTPNKQTRQANKQTQQANKQARRKRRHDGRDPGRRRPEGLPGFRLRAGVREGETDMRPARPRRGLRVQLFLKLAIKCSDVGHAVKKW